MEVFHAQTQLKEHLESIISSKKTIGFVPTMGAIHQGHLSLLQQALNQNDVVVVSIFVNPTQFNNQQDLDKYPRTLERDVALIKMLSDNIIVYAPTVDDIYNGTTIAQKFEYDGLESEMEGANRPGHFDGVGTIVKMLFEIIKPTNAYFGEKDYQQLAIIEKLVQKLHLPVKIHGVPIFREKSGLAMSSRNMRLSPPQHEASKVIYETLKKVNDWAVTKPKEVANSLAPLTGLDVVTLEKALERGGYGINYLNEKVIAEQQKIADTFNELKLIPKKLDIKSVVWLPEQKNK